MILKEKVRIINKQIIATDTVEMQLESRQIINELHAGQFIHISVPGHTLRRPISIANVNSNRNQITILFKQVGAGTKQLASFKTGDTLDVLGPMGNGFMVDYNNHSTVLLVGGGIGVPPLYYLAKSLVKNGCQVIIILGFQSKEFVFYEENFKELGTTYIVTNDGSYGFQGFVTDILPPVGKFDCYYSCGPKPMLKAVQQALKDKPGYLSLEERMGCGIGACYACMIPATNQEGYMKICCDGPVFLASEVLL